MKGATIGRAPSENVGGEPRSATNHRHMPVSDDPHSSHQRAFRRMEGAGVFLVTKCLTPRKPALDSGLASLVGQAICHEARSGRMLLAAFVVMPDHWHAVVGILASDALATRMGVINRWASRKTGPGLQALRTRWQDGYHDTRIRSAKQFAYAINYVRTNPVRAGLTQKAEDWPFSCLQETCADAVTQNWPWRFDYDD